MLMHLGGLKDNREYLLEFHCEILPFSFDCPCFAEFHSISIVDAGLLFLISIWILAKSSQRKSINVVVILASVGDKKSNSNRYRISSSMIGKEAINDPFT